MTTVPTAYSESPATCYLRVQPTFDVPEAWRLRDEIGARTPMPVVIDFGRVREFHDFALAVLVDAVAALGVRALSIQGLGMHQRRLLEYLGFDPQSLAPAGHSH